MAEEKGLNKKVGGAKTSTWLLGGLAFGIVLYVYYRYKRNQAAAAAAIGSTGLVSPSSEPSGAASTTTSGSTTTASIASFQDWEMAVQKWAVSAGFDPAEVFQALATYASGSCVTAGQFSIIDKGLGQFGFPPDAPYQGLVQCPNAPTPAPPPPPTPPPTTPTPPNTQTPISDAQLYQLLTQQIGSLSAETGIGATPEQVRGWFNQYSGETGLQQQFDVEAQNVGFITSHLQGAGRPKSAQDLLPIAQRLAGGVAAFNSLDPLQQQIYLQMANVAAYQQGYGNGSIRKVA